MFSQADQVQIQQKGIPVDMVYQQIGSFQRGIPYLAIKKPAVPGDGIWVPSEKELQEYVSGFENRKTGKKIVKFVPSSGAATRMFKALYEYLAKPKGAILADDIAQVIHRIEAFAFFNELEQLASKQGYELKGMLASASYHQVISYILDKEGLNYGNLPKGLLKFHYYPDGSRTPVEEHLVEGAMYARNSNNSVLLHFTVSPEHLQAFNDLVNQVKKHYEQAYGVKYDVSYSVQSPASDTIAVDGKNDPFRNDDGTLVFRPGGHGALLSNLNNLDADLVFIKNIDNVVPDRLKDTITTYKKLLAGLLLHLQTMVFNYISALEENESHDDELISEVARFIELRLGYKFSKNFENKNGAAKKQALLKVLDRPIRACGMVRNTGEPGGGPYWVEGEEGALSLQILESSQFDLQRESHRQAFKGATHFNPVDLVISTRNHKGQKFDFNQFCDPNTGFISLKSKDGRELKALELPGLWNGAMANWNTAFVEVPVATFNPVKSINDLLRAEHQ